MITNTISVVPYHKYSIMAPKPYSNYEGPILKKNFLPPHGLKPPKPFHPEAFKAETPKHLKRETPKLLDALTKIPPEIVTY